MARAAAGPTQPGGESIHESLTAAWWPAEFFPKVVWDRETKSRRPQIGRGRRRTISPGDVLHGSTLRRIRERPEYAPANLSTSFREYVKTLATVPDLLPYQPDPTKSEKSSERSDHHGR